MQTIVISVQTRDVDLAAREPLVITINERFQDVARAGETNGAAESNEWHRHFGLGLSKTRGPLLEVNSARREAALRLRFQHSPGKQIRCVKAVRVVTNEAWHQEHFCSSLTANLLSNTKERRES